MTIMTIRIPDDVKEAFDKAFEGQDKDAIIAQFIRDGLAARGIAKWRTRETGIWRSAAGEPWTASWSYETKCRLFRMRKSARREKKAAREAS